MSTRRTCQRRTRAVALPALLLLLLLLLLVSVAAPHVRASPADGEPEPTLEGTLEADPYSYLDRFDLAQLKKYALDKYGNRLSVAEYSDKSALLRNVMRLEVQSDKHAALRHRLEELVRSREAARAQTTGDAADTEHKKPRRAASARSATRRYNIVVTACTASENDAQAKKLFAQDVYLGQDVPGLKADFNVSVVPHPPSATRIHLSNAIRGSFFSVIGIALFGGQFMPPAVMEPINRRRGLIISTALALNALAGSVLSTGALEVYVDGVLVYSKLERGRAPLGWELSEIILNNTILAASTGA